MIGFMDNEQQELMLKAKLNMLTKEHRDLDALVKEMVFQWCL